MEGTVYWITGLSGAGKSTLGQLIYNRVKAKKDTVVLLDGDTLRKTIAPDLGYTEEDRHESARRYTRLCKLLADQGIDVVCCTISMFEDIRQWNRDNNKNYKEIYIKASLETLKQRNQKKLYEKKAGEVVGMGVRMEEPQNSDVVVANDGFKSPENVLDEIWRQL